MKVLRRINNNVVVCSDAQGNEVVAMGKGIGFDKNATEVKLQDIERTFYDLDEMNLNIMKDLPEDVISFSGKLIDIARNELDYELTPNVILKLADHIAFIIKRCREGIKVKMPLAYDVEQMFPTEYRIGQYACRKIAHEYNIYVPKSEAVGIAMSLINNRIDTGKVSEKTDEFEEMIETVTETVEEFFKIIIDRESFNYSRFATHIQYLYNRIKEGETIESDNSQLYEKVIGEYPEMAQCTELVAEKIEQIFNCTISEEERLYLLLHINRTCTKEGL